MISELEMAGEFGAVDTREVMGGPDREPVGGHRLRRPWLWALGGAVIASALWRQPCPCMDGVIGSRTCAGTSWTKTLAHLRS